MPKNNLPNDFDPSPFKNSKDDLNHALEDIRILQETISSFIKQVKNIETFFKYFKSHGKPIPKQSEIPILFHRIHPTSLLSETPEQSIFTAILSRSNKELVLGFAYDWLVSQGMIQPMVLKEEFIIGYWKSHFEKILI